MEAMVEETMFESLKRTYDGKNVFITGHTGFKGAWFIKILKYLGANIKGYSLKPKSENDLFNLIKGETFTDTIISDIRDKPRLIEEVLNFQPDFIFHLAAQPLVKLSYDIPSETFEVNAIGTAYLLDAVRLLKKQCSCVFITTDKVYHNYEWEYPYRENDRLGGYDPYSASKSCAELIIDSYRNSYFNISNYQLHKKGIAVARAGNVIGGGDWADHRLIPDIIKNFIKCKNVIIRNPNSIRPWQHVLEPIIGYLYLAKNLEIKPDAFSDAYNFGPNNSDVLSVKEVVEYCIKQWGSGNYEIIEEKSKLHEAGILKLDISKTIKNLNWIPRYDQYQSISITIDWYLSFIDKPNEISLKTEEQIRNFLENHE